MTRSIEGNIIDERIRVTQAQFVLPGDLLDETVLWPIEGDEGSPVAGGLAEVTEVYRHLGNEVTIWTACGCCWSFGPDHPLAVILASEER